MWTATAARATNDTMWRDNPVDGIELLALGLGWWLQGGFREVLEKDFVGNVPQSSKKRLI